MNVFILQNLQIKFDEIIPIQQATATPLFVGVAGINNLLLENGVVGFKGDWVPDPNRFLLLLETATTTLIIGTTTPFLL